MMRFLLQGFRRYFPTAYNKLDAWACAQDADPDQTAFTRFEQRDHRYYHA